MDLSVMTAIFDGDDMLPFTPETLKTLADITEKLRTDIMFGVADPGADPIAEQHFFAAMAQLETAARSFALANLFQVRGLTGR